MSRTAIISAALLAALGLEVALLFAATVVAARVAVHATRSPDRLLDVAFAATFCGIGYLIG